MSDSDYDRWKTEEPLPEELHPEPDEEDEEDPPGGTEPPAGSWAATSRELVRMDLMSGDEADVWKDAMKEEGLE